MKTINNTLPDPKCTFDLATSRSVLKNTNVYNLYVDKTQMSPTVWHEIVFGGDFIQFKLFTNRYHSNILVAFDDPNNEQIEVFDGMKINRLFSRLYLRYKSANERNDTPIQLLIGNFKDQIERNSDLRGYVLNENQGALAAAGGQDIYDYYPTGKKAKIRFHCTTANPEYTITIRTYSQVASTVWNHINQTDNTQQRWEYEVNLQVDERLQIIITNEHALNTLAYTLETEIL